MAKFKIPAQQNEEVVPIPRDTPECRRGRWAYTDGQWLDDCPHSIGDGRRTGWMAGWLDGQSAKKFPHLFN